MGYNISGQWKGFFWYGKEYGELEGASVEFMMFLEESDGVLNGKCFEMGGVGVASGADLALINGFINDRHISFIKRYDFATFLDENGNAFADTSLPSHEIQYEGELNVKDEKFEGSWEIVEKTEDHGDSIIEYISTGTWMMKKEKDI
jgi:hypothetical protein